MHYDDEYVKENNELSFVFYKHKGCRYLEVVSIRSVFLISLFQLKDLLFTLKHTLQNKAALNGIKDDTFYLCRIRITDVYETDYDVLELRDVSNDDDESLRLH